ncbi:hypothetical protein [Sphingomonas sp. LT1P40]
MAPYDCRRAVDICAAIRTNGIHSRIAGLHRGGIVPGERLS